MAELPAAVQAALDAYLAARVDDATWEAYVNSLGSGVALDVATDLCLWTTADTDAVAWIARDFESDPEMWDDPAVTEPPPGLNAIRTLQDFLDAEPGLGSWTITLVRTVHEPANPWNTTHTVRLGADGWESEGHYRAAELLAERERVFAALDGSSERVDPWAVAACRAACLAWSPEWARSQYAKGQA